MAASYSFFPTVASTIAASIRLIRGVDPDVALTTTQSNNAIEALNYILTSTQTYGFQVWLRAQHGPKTLVANQGTYTVGTLGDISIERPTDIYQVWLQDSTGNRLPLTRVSENEFNLLGNLITSSIPNTYMYLPSYQVDTNQSTTSKGTLKIWPTAAATTVSSHTLHFLYTRPLETSTTGTDLLDLPQEWYNYIKWELAFQIAFEWGVPAAELDRLAAKAAQLKEEAMGWDAEKTSLRIFPDPRLLR